ncbi:uncharacterized protein LOC123427407 isoform X2 [Hordeum vulgare subsp. vulgare]|uniref:uncharacterized protein LOC123427407 isoform X2 n=1 Tax=Hordeum vulgare subsp. vulgare TaxID=112509 RepID=UPI001D1A37D3|nr:uncharacterized protein LOC123427407 isoform X2 [Hordeum vulgare subsp. vulgare]
MGTVEEEDLPATDMPRVVGVLSALLERVTERNDAAAGPRAAASAFRAMTKPGISVRAYMARIARFAGCSPACFVVGYIYLDRLLGRRRALAVDSYCVHRLLITTVLSAVKFMDDIATEDNLLSCGHRRLLWDKMLQQRLLRQGGRDQPAGDELPRGGLPLRRRFRPQRVAGDVRPLLRHPPVRDALPGAGAGAPSRPYHRLRSRQQDALLRL